MGRNLNMKAKTFSRFNQKEIINLLKQGKVGIIKTDTIYGILGSALNKETVKRIYRLKKRTKKKSAIVLISSLSQLKLFGIKTSLKEKKLFSLLWPSKISISLYCPSQKFSYLHQGRKRFAFRLIKEKKLKNLIDKTGPLIAPSANLQDQKPAQDIKEAKKYFKNKVDFYVKDKRVKNPLPSTLIEIKEKSIIVHRKGLDFSKLKKIKGYKILWPKKEEKEKGN